ncbi:MAG: alpha/beta fold hydrolase, partial [Actinomycetia bacterium]|nr:alpha/beta fold hydrolase [Actinomycetes bacterium]
PPFAEHFRVITADYPGFGLSDDPSDGDYSPGAHSRAVGELVDHLGLDNMIVFGTDWGGPIGFDIASRRADRVAALVMGNTFYWPQTATPIRLFSKTFGTGLMRRLIEKHHFMVKVAMKQMLATKPSAAEWAHYVDVAPTPQRRKGMAILPGAVLEAREWLAELETRVDSNLADRPLLLFNGPRDPALGTKKMVIEWKARFPHLELAPLPGAGHFYCEDQPDAVIAKVLAVFTDNQKTN